MFISQFGHWYKAEKYLHKKINCKLLSMQLSHLNLYHQTGLKTSNREVNLKLPQVESAPGYWRNTKPLGKNLTKLGIKQF